MKYSIEFSSEVQKTLRKWKKSNPRSFKKLHDLLPELESHPREGIGHPEPLKGYNNIRYSRRLSGQDRVIYDIYDETVTILVIQIGGHYDDK